MSALYSSAIINRNSILRKSTGRRRPNYDELRYIPMLTGAISPLSIMMSIPPITGCWKNYVSIEGCRGTKYIAYTVIMAIAISFSLCGNSCLLCRFLEKRIVLNTWLSVGFFLLHAILMSIPLIHFIIYNPSSSSDKYTGDFAAGIVVVALSLFSSILLLVDYFRYNRLRLRGSGMSHKQRNLVFFCIFVTIWSSLGAFVFSYFEKWSFSRGIYFTLVTMTIIGFGDYVPKETGDRIFLFFYATVGIAAMGNLINAIRVVFLEQLEDMIHSKFDEFGMVELERFFTFDKNVRSKEVNSVGQTNQVIEPKSTIGSRVEILFLERETLVYRQFKFSILFLVIFWFGGAGFFLIVEDDRTYFDALYFCFVSFTTIGYGDVTVKSFYGIIVFIGYALLGLVAVAYLISVVMELWSLMLEKSATRVDFKRRRKADIMDLDESEDPSYELASALDHLEHPAGDQETVELIQLLEVAKLYHLQVSHHLSECEDKVHPGTFEESAFKSLIRYQKLLGKALRRYQSREPLLSAFNGPSPCVQNRSSTDTTTLNTSPHGTTYTTNAHGISEIQPP